MADSPLTWRQRLLTRSDSLRFIASRGGVIGFTYVFTFASVLLTLFLLLNPSSYQLSPWLRNAFHSSGRYNFSSVFGHIFTNSSFSPPPYTPYSTTQSHEISPEELSSLNASVSSKDGAAYHSLAIPPSPSPSPSQISRKEGSGFTQTPGPSSNQKEELRRDIGLQNGVQPPQQQQQQQKPSPTNSPTPSPGMAFQNVMQSENWMELSNCDMFEGSWVRDDSYPLYRPGSCPHIDESFNCFLNGRSDNMYEKFRWQPKNCNMPRLNGNDMLEILRGKRLVFVGDSLNRNMWESLVCILGNSLQDKSRMFEASGREEFRTEDSYSFIFIDYNCSIEFVRSPFLVQEWEVDVPDQKGSKKETLRLDLVERSYDKYKNADVLIFNTGHWWTHEKRTIGKEYYQEGNHVHGQLNVEEAIQKALLTWSRWVDANIDPKKTIVFFRGYSPSHFRGGEWNSGGQCENETEPMRNEADLSDSEFPPMMKTIESVIKGMKTPVLYLNITKMTDFRHDAHPSLYRSMNMTEETKRDMLTHQDCSHWCLPGVPDLWNELVYAHLLYSMKRNKGNPQQ